MHASSGISEPHCSGASTCHRRHRLHGGCVDCLRHGLSAQVRDVIVACCVAAGDERYEYE
eukprot:6175955-Pleurochrysis_carterae.AAC.2